MGTPVWGEGAAEFDSRLVGVNPEAAGVTAAEGQEGCLGPERARVRGFCPGVGGRGPALPPGRLPAGSAAAEARQAPILTSHSLGGDSECPSGRCLETLMTCPFSSHRACPQCGLLRPGDCVSDICPPGAS